MKHERQTRSRYWNHGLLCLLLVWMSVPVRGDWFCANGTPCPMDCPLLAAADVSAPAPVAAARETGFVPRVVVPERRTPACSRCPLPSGRGAASCPLPNASAARSASAGVGGWCEMRAGSRCLLCVRGALAAARQTAGDFVLQSALAVSAAFAGCAAPAGEGRIFASAAVFRPPAPPGVCRGRAPPAACEERDAVFFGRLASADVPCSASYALFSRSTHAPT